MVSLIDRPVEDDYDDADDDDDNIDDDDDDNPWTKLA